MDRKSRRVTTGSRRRKTVGASGLKTVEELAKSLEFLTDDELGQLEEQLRLTETDPHRAVLLGRIIGQEMHLRTQWAILDAYLA